MKKVAFRVGLAGSLKSVHSFLESKKAAWASDAQELIAKLKQAFQTGESFSFSIAFFGANWEDGDGCQVVVTPEKEGSWVCKYQDNSSGVTYYEQLESLHGKSVSPKEVLSAAFSAALEAEENRGSDSDFYLGGVE